MADKKKFKAEELTDEQANAAAGGFGNVYKCEGGCGGSYSGDTPHLVDGRPYCEDCYAKYQQSHAPVERPDHPERPERRERP